MNTDTGKIYSPEEMKALDKSLKGIPTQMKTHYKYIHFEERPNPGKRTSKWNCLNNNDGDELCEIRWSGGWRQYVTRFTAFHCMSYYEFNADCLTDLADFLSQLNKLQRGKWKSKDGSK